MTSKKCKKCGKSVDGIAKFCHYCGEEIEKIEKFVKKEVKQFGSKNILIFSIIGIIVVLGIVVFAVPLPYTATEAYTVKEPYQSTEYYSDTEQYTDKECEDISLTKNIKWGTTQTSCLDTECNSYRSVCVETNWLGNCIEYQDVCQSTSCTRYKIYCNVVVKNLDNQGGTFSFDGYNVTKDEDEHYVKALSQYLQPGDETAFGWEYNVDVEDWGNCRYSNFITPKKTECENVVRSRTVQKSRPTTKYSDVEKTRTVTRYATLFQRWTGRVQWYYKV